MIPNYPSIADDGKEYRYSRSILIAQLCILLVWCYSGVVAVCLCLSDGIIRLPRILAVMVAVPFAWRTPYILLEERRAMRERVHIDPRCVRKFDGEVHVEIPFEYIRVAYWNARENLLLIDQCTKVIKIHFVHYTFPVRLELMEKLRSYLPKSIQVNWEEFQERNVPDLENFERGRKLSASYMFRFFRHLLVLLPFAYALLALSRYLIGIPRANWPDLALIPPFSVAIIIIKYWLMRRIFLLHFVADAQSTRSPHPS